MLYNNFINSWVNFEYGRLSVYLSFSVWWKKVYEWVKKNERKKWLIHRMYRVSNNTCKQIKDNLWKKEKKKRIKFFLGGFLRKSSLKIFTSEIGYECKRLFYMWKYFYFFIKLIFENTNFRNRRLYNFLIVYVHNKGLKNKILLYIWIWIIHSKINKFHSYLKSKIFLNLFDFLENIDLDKKILFYSFFSCFFHRQSLYARL